MDWPQRQRFRDEVDRYQARTGETHAAIAKRLDIGLGTLRNYLYGSKKPGLATCQKASALFGCSITVLVDDPGKRATQEVGEGTQAFLDAMQALSTRMRPDQREWLIQSARALVKTTKQGRPADLPGKTTGEKCRHARENVGHTLQEIVAYLKTRNGGYPISEKRLERIEADKDDPEELLLIHLGDAYGVEGYKLRATPPDAPKPKAERPTRGAR